MGTKKGGGHDGRRVGRLTSCRNVPSPSQSPKNEANKWATLWKNVELENGERLKLKKIRFDRWPSLGRQHRDKNWVVFVIQRRSKNELYHQKQFLSSAVLLIQLWRLELGSQTGRQELNLGPLMGDTHFTFVPRTLVMISFEMYHFSPILSKLQSIWISLQWRKIMSPKIAPSFVSNLTSVAKKLKTASKTKSSVELISVILDQMQRVCYRLKAEQDQGLLRGLTLRQSSQGWLVAIIWQARACLASIFRAKLDRARF